MPPNEFHVSPDDLVILISSGMLKPHDSRGSRKPRATARPLSFAEQRAASNNRLYLKARHCSAIRLG